jgi:hypothetical protein
MRYQEVLRISMVFVVGVLFLSSCGKPDLGEFQDNDTYEYKLFDLLGDKVTDPATYKKYHALHDALHLQDPTQIDPDSTWLAKQCDKTQARLDQCIVNDLLSDAIDAHYVEDIKVMAGQYVTVDSTLAGIPNQYPLQNIVQLLRHLIYRINNQDTLDNDVFDTETNQRTSPALSYAAEFFGFLDNVNQQNLKLGTDLVAIMDGMSRFRVDNLKDDSLMRKEVEFSNIDMDSSNLDDTNCQNYRNELAKTTPDQEKKEAYRELCKLDIEHYIERARLLGLDATPCRYYYSYIYNNSGACDLVRESVSKHVREHVLAHHKSLTYGQTSIGKSNLRADYPMCLNSSGVLITKSEDMTGCVTNLGLGNAVQGNQSLLMALFALVKDSGFNSSLYELIRQLGVFLSGSVPNQPDAKIADVAVALIKNIQSYFTTGGANATGIYNTDDDVMYSSTELRNTLRELQPGLARMMLRSDREPASLIYEVSDKKKLYVFDEFIKGLKSIRWNPNDARIEESLDDLIRYDQYGRDRTTDANAHNTSQLESLFFLTSVAANYGWTDACKDTINGETTPPGGNTSCAYMASSGNNWGHGHGLARQGRANANFNSSPTRSAGSTMNDALYAMGTNKILTILTQYEITFNSSDQEHLFRSLYPFKIAPDTTHGIPGKDDNRFYFDQNYPISFFVTGAVGAPGSPTGGVAPKDSGGNFILNGYMPFNPLGDNNDNIALTTSVALWHVCWNGYGPYYYDPAKVSGSSETVNLYGKTWNIIKRANGKIYALVYKAANGNWEYLYPPNNWDFVNPPNPATSDEPLYPMAFYVGHIADSVTLTAQATVNITIDNHTYPVTFAAGAWNRDSVITALKAQINTPFTVIPFGENKFRIAGNPQPTVSSKIIRIENVSGPNAVELLFGGNESSIVREQWRAEFWNSVNYSDYYMGWYVDGLDLFRPNHYSTITRNDAGDIELVDLHVSDPEGEPSGVLTEELISDADPIRACGSQEEAFFRNYQWFFNERKHLLIMPQRIFALGLENGIIYVYQESNGFYGFANARPFKGNQVWAKAGTTGRSTVPGDHRMGVVADFSGIATALGQTPAAVYNSTLGGGPGFSSVLAHNLASLARLAFPTVIDGSTYTDENGDTHTEPLVPSYAFTVGDNTWNKRNAVMPILMAMFNALRANTDYQRSNTTGLVPFYDSMTILLKPVAYYQKGSGNVPNNTWKYRVLGDANDAYFLKAGGEFYKSGSTYGKPDIWYGSDVERNYFQPAAVNTLFSMLIDSNRYTTSEKPDKKIMDGILPLLVAENPDTHERPRVATQAFNLLMSIGKDTVEFNDPAGTNYDVSTQEFDKNWQSWGARRKLFYALEQTALLSKSTRGRFTQINEPTLTERLPDWMFTSGVGGSDYVIPNDMRQEEIYGNIGQNILVGSNGTDIAAGALGYHMGLAYMPTDWEQNPDKLTLFRKYLEMASEVLKPKPSACDVPNPDPKVCFSVVENLINVMDKFFNKVTPTNDQIKGLVHTLGIMATTYDSTNKVWNVPTGSWTTDGKIVFDDPARYWENQNWVDDLYRITAQYQPIQNLITLALDAGVELSFDERNGTKTIFNTSNYIYDSSVFLSALLKTRGLMEYVLNVVDTTDTFSEIFSELYGFLNEHLLRCFQCKLWDDVAVLMAGEVQVLTRNNTPTAKRDQFQDLGFQYNGP